MAPTTILSGYRSCVSQTNREDPCREGETALLGHTGQQPRPLRGFHMGKGGRSGPSSLEHIPMCIITS